MSSISTPPSGQQGQPAPANGSSPSSATPQQKMQQFMQMLPITLAIAGLPESDHGKYFNEDQMDVRARILRTAYKQAKLLVKEIIAE